MLGELEWIRWQLDRLAAARLGGRLDPAREDEYERLCERERELMQTRAPEHEREYSPATPGAAGDEIDLREHRATESPHRSA